MSATGGPHTHTDNRSSPTHTLTHFCRFLYLEYIQRPYSQVVFLGRRASALRVDIYRSLL
jgi:hypothetical protein